MCKTLVKRLLPYSVLCKYPLLWGMTKKRSSEILTDEMNIFLGEKVTLKISVDVCSDEFFLKHALAPYCNIVYLLSCVPETCVVAYISFFSDNYLLTLVVSTSESSSGVIYSLHDNNCFDHRRESWSWGAATSIFYNWGAWGLHEILLYPIREYEVKTLSKVMTFQKEKRFVYTK